MSTDFEQIDWGHWVIRLVALIIDSLIIGIPTAIIWFALTVSAFFFASAFFIFYGAWLILPLILGVLLLLYFMILDAYWGATIGKRLLGLHVQMANGGKVPFDKAFIRNISKIYWPFLLLDWLVGIVTPGDKRQKYTDRIAGTTVIQTRQAFQTTAEQPPPPPPPPPS
ncbi:MAG: RDD family protein [Candidatus Bathyarchaeota archaeon]|nr:RDD family protein [Candidatus Bathyarchaeota archaeon]